MLEVEDGNIEAKIRESFKLEGGMFLQQYDEEWGEYVDVQEENILAKATIRVVKTLSTVC